MRLKSYIKEMAVEASNNWADASKLYNDAAKNIKKYGLWNDPVVWRGFGGFGNQYIIKVTTDYGGFRGQWSEPVKKVISLLDLDTDPIFVTKTYDQARFFGSARIFIPASDFKVYVNPDVKDIASINPKIVNIGGDREERWGGENPEEIAKGYKVTKNVFPAEGSKRNQEMIITCKEYYLSYPEQMLQFTKKSKFAKIKTVDDIKRYGDVVILYYDFESYIKWHARMRAKENKHILKNYIETGHYPKEWFEDLI